MTQPTVTLDEVIASPISGLRSRPPVCVESGTSIDGAIAAMQEHRIGCVLVTEGGRLVGIFTERDVMLKVVGHKIDGKAPVSRLMTPDPEVLSPTHEIAYALNRMSLGGYRHVPLVDRERRPLAVLSVKDMINHIVEHFPRGVYNLPPEPDVISTAADGA